MIGQATAHRRANSFALAIEDAGLDGGVHGEIADAFASGTDSPDGTDAGSTGSTGHTGSPGSGVGSAAGHPGPSHAADRHAAPEQAAMVALAGAISGRPRPVMDPEHKAVQRAQLIAAMEQAIADGSFRATTRVPEQRGGSPVVGLRRLTPRSRLTRRLAVGGLTMGVAAGAFGGVAAASTNALPGDSLYGLKRGMEDLKLDMAGSDSSRGKVYLDLAGTRMQEARRLMDRGRGGQLDPESLGEVRKALNGMQQEAVEGHRLLSAAYRKDGSLEPMETLNDFAQSHRQGWADLRQKLPTQLTDVSEQVSSVFDAIDAEVAPLALPQKDHSGSTGSRGTATGAPGRSTRSPGGSPSQSATGTPSEGQATPSGSPSPSASSSATSGLIGGDSGLLPSLPTPSQPGTPSTSATPEQHSVELPPLLPGLLPGLGLTSDEDNS
ncbi:DUF5667 domain-containing protein [Actinacidiphila yeochonensis]|uniref:DUF5667 domain-containing protein n=1 Tax=Actinacidiphila yeochonensis TaxID=89050 RepID=UPI00056B4C0B|nr:DUF5667 domain-containing protein [Actinacidiphila yeochonensis]